MEREEGEERERELKEKDRIKWFLGFPGTTAVPSAYLDKILSLMDKV